MKIDVRINSLTPDNGSIKAIASVNFGDCLAVKGVKVMEGKNGLFLSMPSQKSKDGNYHDICFPITADFRNQLNNAVEQAYNQAITQVQEQKMWVLHRQSRMRLLPWKCPCDSKNNIYHYKRKGKKYYEKIFKHNQDSSAHNKGRLLQHQSSSLPQDQHRP